MNDLKKILDTYFNVLSKAGIVLVILSSFFLFTNFTTEFYDTNKFLVLLFITGILLVLIFLKFSFSGKVILIRTPLDVPLLLLLAVAIVSTILSPAPFVSLLGNQLKIHASLTSLIVYVLFYFVLINSLKSKLEIKTILFISTLAAALLSAVSLLTFFGFKVLPAPWNHGINFTPTGSSFSTTAILALLVPLVTSQILTVTNPMFLILNSSLLALFGATIALTGNLATWLGSLIGLLITLSSYKVFDKFSEFKPTKIIALIVPAALIILVAALALIPPMGKAVNPLYTQSKNFPRELQLDLVTSWKTSVSSFRDNPIWGSGPGTYLFDFTNYKPIEFNSSKNWNIRFDTSFNEYLQVLATLGLVGLIALLSLTALFISAAWPYLKAGELKTSLAISGLIFFFLLFSHPSTLVVWVFGLFILAAFMVVDLPVSSAKQWHSLLQMAKNVASTDTSEETIRIDALPSVLLTLALGLVLFTFFFASKFALADYHHRLALNAVAQNQGIQAYNELIASEKLNSISDVYRIDLAQTNFALANAIASAKGPTEASPSGTLTDQDKQNIQVLLQQSINEGKAATALNPKSALNWEILGLLYRQIAGVAQNALVFSLDAYGRAIFQDPLNPNLRLSVGGVYYAIQNYDLATRFFTDAINLKPDFANGYYNLAVTLRDKEDLVNAQAAAEKVLTLVEKDSPDYKVAESLVSELKKAQENKVVESSTTQPPAAQTDSALQKKNLPKVVDVGTPPTKIATPSAVKKPNSTPEPTANP